MVLFLDISAGLLLRPEALPPQSDPDGVQPGARHETALRTVVPGRLHDEDVGPPRFHRDQVPRGDRRLGLGGRAEVAAHGAFGVIFFYVFLFAKSIFCNDLQRISCFAVFHTSI